MSNAKHYIWSAIGKFGTEIISFAGNVLVARILMPEDYGLVAMVSIFITLCMNFTDAGFNDGLIRKSECDKYDIGTVATYNMTIAVLLYAVMYFLAPVIAHFFDRSELIGVTRVLAIGIILKSFSLSGFVQLIKSLRFKTITLINIICSILALAVVYIMALNGLKYWALVLQPIAIAIFNVLSLFIIAKWKPYFCFKWNRFKEMFSFSSNILVSYLVTTVGNNIYGFIIGKFYSAGDLGFYNQAHKMQQVPTQGINNVVLTTSYPIIAKEKESDKRYGLYISLFKRYNFVMTFIVFLLMGLSEFVFYVIFSEKWLPSAPLFSIFILSALAYPMMTINANIVKIQGKSKIYRNLAFLRSGLQIVALIICSRFSLETIIVGQVVAAFLSVSVDMYVCGKTIGFTIRKQYLEWLKILWKPLLVYAVTSLIVYVMQTSIVISGIVFLLVYCSFFIALCEIVRDSSYMSFRKYVINLFRNK